MAEDRIASAQRGIPLAQVVAAPSPAKAARAAGRAGQRHAAKAQPAAMALTGPFLSPGTLSRAERLRLIEGLERVIEGAFTHLPLKRARYGFDPVQRLRILRTQIDELRDDAFHIELADIVTRMRDAHTRYVGPAVLASKVAALPFLVEMTGTPENPTYVISKVGRVADPSFTPGVVVEFWNGVPIDRAVQRHGEREVGGRPDSQRAWSTQSLTLRALQYGPPPDELWVIVGYRVVSGNRPTGPVREVRIPWQVIDPDQVDPLAGTAPTGRTGARLRRLRAIDPAAAAVRRAKMLLYAPNALSGEQATIAAAGRKTVAHGPLGAQAIPTRMTQVLKAMSLDAPGGPYGYLRIWAFGAAPGPFVKELQRLIPLLPDRGLIIDVRGNPGGYILAAEFALQLFTPKRIEPTRFAPLATPLLRAMSALPGLADDLAPWKPSLEAAVRNGELYAQPIPISDPAECNAIGQQYGGPVVLVGDSTTYSAGDLFSAGFVDNAIGPFVCVGTATGAGGANVWDYEELRKALRGSAFELPVLPDGIGLSFSFRRATRAGPSEGLPIEDVGVAGMPYAMTRDDLLADNRDLIAHCLGLIRDMPFTRLKLDVSPATRTVTATAQGLSRLDAFFDGHAGESRPVPPAGTVAFDYPAGTTHIEIVGFAAGDVRQRRRLRVAR